MKNVLILGGTKEARLLCERLAQLDISALVSLAGATRSPAEMPVPTRTGGFGGVAGLTEWLVQHHPNAVIDATHPFAQIMPWNVHRACRNAAIPRLRLLRPGFGIADTCTTETSITSALTSLPKTARILLTTGRSELEILSERPELTVFLRTIEPVANLPGNVTPLRINPPLTVEMEQDLLREHRIDVLITKNSGGATAPKLTAAARLGVKVILIDRPEQPPGPTVQSPDQAVAWLRHVVGIGN